MKETCKQFRSLPFFLLYSPQVVAIINLLSPSKALSSVSPIVLFVLLLSAYQQQLAAMTTFHTRVPKNITCVRGGPSLFQGVYLCVLVFCCCGETS